MSECAGCGNAVPAQATVCPSCHALLHAARLKALAAQAEELTQRGEHADAARVWREALLLLPPDSKQFAAVAANVEAAVARIRRAPATGSRWAKVFGPVGVVAVALLTKGKLLLLGLTKMTTIFSMLAFLAVYWRAWGWPFALAVIATIYIHEVGHVAAMARRGMPAAAPMFIPGVGAFVRMSGPPATPSEDAKIGLAGPLWGLGAAIAAALIFFVARSPFWLAVAHTTAMINIFNLTPVWQLDGSRGFNGLSRPQRWIAVAVIGAAFAVARDGVIALVGLVAIWRAFQKNAPARPDWQALTTYALLLGALTAVVGLTAQ